jgi:hypothetical protein
MAVLAACIAAPFAAAQTQTSIAVFPPVDVRLSANGTGYGSANADIFSSSTRSITCPQYDIHAVLSSQANGTAKVLVDNFINVTFTQGKGAPHGPINICSGGVIEHGNQEDCFTTGYQVPASEGKLTGVDPDTLVATGGVGPFDISSYLAPGLNQVKIDLVDTGGYLASSSIYLDTNCTSNGVTGPAQISGNPIPSTNPSPALLKQQFSFNTAGNQVVQQLYDLSTAASQKTLTIANGTIPTVADLPLDPAKWQPNYAKGTSFATSQCLIHTGETLNGKPACKLYTVTCQIGQGSEGSGAQCPISTVRNEVFEDTFDGPAFTLPDIHSGKFTFHQGVGYLMASEGWEGLACVFDQASGLEHDLCPQNFLTLFSGPGAYGGKGTSTHPNSTFITVAPVPEDLTTVTLSPSRTWVNHHTVKANISSIPPVVPAPNNGFVAAPILSITYGISPANDVPSTEFPVPGDIVLDNPVGCPTPGNSGGIKAAYFKAPDQEITVSEDGQYLIHYFATDCAGTEELKFLKDSSGSWHTTFYTVPLNVDTVPPDVPKDPVLSPAPTLIHGVLGYAVGEQVTAKYHCSDNLSGVAVCGTVGYSNPVKDPPAQSSLVDTSSPGKKTFTVLVQDAAGNNGVPRSVTYTVVTP